MVSRAASGCAGKKQGETKRVEKSMSNNGDPQVAAAANIDPGEQKAERHVAQNTDRSFGKMDDSENNAADGNGRPPGQKKPIAQLRNKKRAIKEFFSKRDRGPRQDHHEDKKRQISDEGVKAALIDCRGDQVKGGENRGHDDLSDNKKKKGSEKSGRSQADGSDPAGRSFETDFSPALPFAPEDKATGEDGQDITEVDDGPARERAYADQSTGDPHQNNGGGHQRDISKC